MSSLVRKLAEIAPEPLKHDARLGTPTGFVKFADSAMAFWLPPGRTAEQIKVKSLPAPVKKPWRR